MNRRKFLTITGLGTAAVAIPTIGLNSNSLLKKAISNIITSKLDYLKIGQESIEKFSNDFIQYMETLPFTYTQKLRFQIFSNSLAKNGTQDSKVSELLVSNFLLSTDFFLNKMDESKAVQYTGLFNSYYKPCSNPFSHLYYPKVNI